MAISSARPTKAGNAAARTVTVAFPNGLVLIAGFDGTTAHDLRVDTLNEAGISAQEQARREYFAALWERVHLGADASEQARDAALWRLVNAQNAAKAAFAAPAGPASAAVPASEPAASPVKARRQRKAKKPAEPTRDELAAQIAASLPADDAGLMGAGRAAVRAYHDAMMASDAAAAADATRIYDACIWRLSGDTFFGSMADEQSGGRRLAAHCAAEDGARPLWGQKARFVVDIGSVRAIVSYSGMDGAVSQHFEFRAIDQDRPFISDTGYRSHFFKPAPGRTVYDQAAEALAYLTVRRKDFCEGLRLIKPEYRDRVGEIQIPGPVITPAAAPSPADQPAPAKPRRTRKAKPKPSRAELSVFWSLRTAPIPAGTDTLDDGATIWACTVLDAGFEKEIRAQHAPQYQLGSGWAAGWTPIVAAPKRWSPERKAQARRRNLRRRLEKKFPLLADLFEVAEIERRPAYFDAAGIEAGADMLPCQDRAGYERIHRSRVPRPVAPPPPCEQHAFSLAEPEAFDPLQIVPHTPKARALRRAALYAAAMGQPAKRPPQPWARPRPGMTVAEHCRRLAEEGGAPVFPDDLGRAPFDLADAGQPAAMY